MIHEHEATELASAAIDFGLSPELDRELTLALRECPICAERAAAYHEQIRLMQRLPALGASEHTRQRITAAALSGRATTRSPLVFVLAAALLMAMLLGVAAAAGALLSQSRDELSVADPSQSPSPIASSIVDDSPLPASIDPAGGQVFADALRTDSIVEVVSDNVRVRSEPRVAGDSKMLTPLLRLGDRLFVVEGPVVASGYDWYRVAPIGSNPARPSTTLPSGWVSRGDHDGSPWIAPVALDCPLAPFEIATLNAMHPLERLSCFQDEPFSIQAIIEGGAQDGWIADAHRFAYLEAAVPDMEVVIEPSADLPAASLPDGRAAVLHGALDQPDCVRLAEPEEILSCRTRFVVTRSVVDPIQLNDGDFAITLSGDLRVRDQPGVDAGPGLIAMAAGTRVAVIGGPGIGSGYVWFRVAVPSSRLPDGQPLVGWVASHGKDGEQWLGAEEFDCPSPAELTFDQFAFLTSPSVYHGGLACYGGDGPYAGAELTAEGRARLDCSGPPPAGSMWLMDHQRSLVLVNDGVEARVAMRSYPGSISCDADADRQIYRALGHFDDPAASGCRSAEVDSETADPIAVYGCRARFVVTELEVVGPPPTRPPTP